LIQPGDAFKEVNGDFLKSNGEGIDHIAYTVDAEHFEREVEKMKAKGLTILFSGRQTNGGGFAYFDTRRVGGIITELMVTPS
jgi:catechol 2,3-dioxygenase-like lactoylglutathione lyase family enzyme